LASPYISCSVTDVKQCELLLKQCIPRHIITEGELRVQVPRMRKLDIIVWEPALDVAPIQT